MGPGSMTSPDYSPVLYNHPHTNRVKNPRSSFHRIPFSGNILNLIPGRRQPLPDRDKGRYRFSRFKNII
jgi:hypothetical protein